jgi:hypothetical protein
MAFAGLLFVTIKWHCVYHCCTRRFPLSTNALVLDDWSKHFSPIHDEDVCHHIADEIRLHQQEYTDMKGIKAGDSIGPPPRVYQDCEGSNFPNNRCNRQHGRQPFVFVENVVQILIMRVLLVQALPYGGSIHPFESPSTEFVHTSKVDRADRHVEYKLARSATGRQSTATSNRRLLLLFIVVFVSESSKCLDNPPIQRPSINQVVFGKTEGRHGHARQIMRVGAFPHKIGIPQAKQHPKRDADHKAGNFAAQSNARQDQSTPKHPRQAGTSPVRI